MSEAATQQVPGTATEGYALVRDLIFSQVYRFQRQYGGDFDDLVGEAHVAFMKGHIQCRRGTRPNGKRLETTYAAEIRRWVWFDLFDAMRIRVNQKTRMGLVGLGEYDPPARHDPEWDTARWVRLLTADGRRAAELVLHPPQKVAAVAEGKGGTPRNYRSTVRSYLRAEGWTPKRINEAYEDIRAALG